MNKKVLFIVHAAVIAALYVVLTLLANALGLANYAVQVRFSEALTILPFFTPAAIPGLCIGCLLSNIMTGCALPDIIFGTAATLLGAVFTYLLRNHKWLAPIPPIVANTVIIPFVHSVCSDYQCTYQSYPVPRTYFPFIVVALYPVLYIFPYTHYYLNFALLLGFLRHGRAAGVFCRRGIERKLPDNEGT